MTQLLTIEEMHELARRAQPEIDRQRARAEKFMGTAKARMDLRFDRDRPSVSPVRIYHRYPTEAGATAQSRCYDGIYLNVAAVSAKQASYLAGADQWFHPALGHGIVSSYGLFEPSMDIHLAGRDNGHFGFCGCHGHGLLEFGGGETEKQIHQAIREHRDEHRPGCALFTVKYIDRLEWLS